MTQIITTSTTTDGANITAAASEFIYIAEGVTRASNDNYALTSSAGSATIEVLGNLVGFLGMYLSDYADSYGNFQINIGSKGSVVGRADGLFLADAENFVSNAGEITAIDGHAIFSTGANFQFVNSGTITSQSMGCINSTGSGSTIINHGLIQSLGDPSSAYAVRLGDSDPSADVHLMNYGTISATGGMAVLGDNDDVDKIWNFGLLNGGVAQHGGDDLFRNGGQVVGNVNLGKGNDVFKGWEGTVEGNIHGGGGNDAIAGGISNDAIFGNNGADILKGGQGDDTLTGGAGRDHMRGGLGLDAFDFNSTTDSAVGSQRDQIMDFSKADDVIDLAGIDAKTGVVGNQAFHFIAASAFSGTAGELRAVNSGRNAIVSGDVDGNSHADFSIMVQDVQNLHAADFVL